jgi:hypothetical protein
MTDLRPLDLIPIVAGLEHLAPLVQPWIVKGCAYSGEWTLEEIAEGLAQDKLQLWACWQSDPPECWAAASRASRSTSAARRSGAT